jgi:hypothetical protein
MLDRERRSTRTAPARTIPLLLPTLMLATPSFAAPLPHDGIGPDAVRREKPRFAIVEGANDYVRSVARRSAVGGPSFSVIGLPDTQNYSSSYPQIFTAQTDWIAANRTALDVRYVSHYGDIVNNADQPAPWVNANASMSGPTRSSTKSPTRSKKRCSACKFTHHATHTLLRPRAHLLAPCHGAWPCG